MLIAFDDGKSLVARFLLSPEYPQASPPFVELEGRPKEAFALDGESLEAPLRTFWEDCGRDVVLFTYIEWLRERLLELIPPPADAVRPLPVRHWCHLCTRPIARHRNACP